MHVITAARLDVQGRHVSEVQVGDFEDPGLYHLAVRIQKQTRVRINRDEVS